MNSSKRTMSFFQKLQVIVVRHAFPDLNINPYIFFSTLAYTLKYNEFPLIPHQATIEVSYLNSALIIFTISCVAHCNNDIPIMNSRGFIESWAPSKLTHINDLVINFLACVRLLFLLSFI